MPDKPDTSNFKDRVKIGLDESRMLMLGMQVLVGVEFNSVFQETFSRLPADLQWLKLAALALQLVALGLIVSPIPFHQLVGRGENSPATVTHVTRAVGIALLPFALGLALDIYVVVVPTAGQTAALVGAGLAFLLAIFFWYGLGLINRDPALSKKHEEVIRQMEDDPEAQKADLKDKIDFALTETRVVLPGAQALLGFQFLTILTQAFERLPAELKYLHLASLAAMSIAIMLLIAPAAFHRIADSGENSERMPKVAARMILTAMVFVALGIVGDLYMVTWIITASATFAAITAIVMLVFFYGLWFGYSLYRRSRSDVPKEPSSVDSPRRSAV